jgi:hypothetical protein
VCGFYGRFLSINKARTTPIIATKTNSPAIAGTKYMSAVDCSGSAVGPGVVAAGSTAKLVSAYDGQYALEPAKVAKTVNLPDISGVHSIVAVCVYNINRYWNSSDISRFRHLHVDVLHPCAYTFVRDCGYSVGEP